MELPLILKLVWWYIGYIPYWKRISKRSVRTTKKNFSYMKYQLRTTADSSAEGTFTVQTTKD